MRASLYVPHIGAYFEEAKPLCGGANPATKTLIRFHVFQCYLTLLSYKIKMLFEDKVNKH